MKRSSRLSRWARVILGFAGTAFLLVAISSQWNTVTASVEFSWTRLAISVLLILLSIAALAQGWARLFAGQPQSKRLRRVFYLAQPSKYIPGGVVQPLGQIALTTAEGVPAGKSATAFLVHSLASAAAGATLGIGVVVVPDTPPLIRLAAVLGIVGPLLIWRPPMVKVAKIVARVTKRELDETLIPDQGLILRAYGWAILGLLVNGVAFGILAGNTFDAPFWGLVVAFSFAFTVGFVAIPFPAGVGIREGVLVAAFPGVGLAPVVAVSALHRLATMFGELMIVGTTTRMSRRPNVESASDA